MPKKNVEGTYANPEEGVYVNEHGKIFALVDQDGPYSLLDEPGDISLYTYVDESGRYPKTAVRNPFTCPRLDTAKFLSRKKK